MGLVRPARNGDCEALASIYQESLDARDCSMETSTSPGRFRSMLEGFGEREVMLVLEDEGSVKGWGVVKKYSDRVGYRVACETSIYLSRKSTGAGYGTLLQSKLMEKVRDFGYHHIVTRIWASNTGSIKFHERFGFRMVGVQKEVGHLGGEWRDVAILQCLLEDVPPYRPQDG